MRERHLSGPAGLVSLTGALLVGMLALRGWRYRLDRRRKELPEAWREPEPGRHVAYMSRIEAVDLRERVRKLERIAQGLDI